MTETLEASNLCCIRDDRVLFDQLSFKITTGQVLLLEGKNGSGKTSLLRLLCGFRQPDIGDIFWCGEKTENNSRYFTDMVYLGHLDGIKKELTVLENLKIAYALGLSGTHTFEQALQRVHLSGYEDVPVQSLSAGQKRRVAFARLLVTKNKLWILDEPFTSMDKEGVSIFESLMREHVSGDGIIVLTSHHDVSLSGADVQTIMLN